MKSMPWKVVGGTVLALAMGWMLQPASANDDKVPTIKEVMGKVNKPKGLMSELRADLKKPEVDWEHVQEHAKELATFVKAMPKNEPPKGSKDSWEKFTKAYVKNATALETSTKAKDKDKTNEAMKKLSDSCKACHSAHK